MTRLSRAIARRATGREDGVVLVLALVFLSFFGLAIASLLGFADANFLALQALRSQRGVVYASEGAVEGGINSIRGDLTQGRDGGSCTSFTLPSTNGVSASATCTGQPGSGQIVGPNPNNRPLYSILTLGTGVGGEPGIEQAANVSASINGDTFSNSTIEVATPLGAMLVTGSVYAKGACSGNIVPSSPPPHCNYVPSPGEGEDPNYDKATATVPTPRSVPSCPADPTQRLIQFTPGFYDDATALTALTDGSCAGALLYFPPVSSPAGVGVYYFNFRNNSDTWVVNDATVNIVGGTPKGWIAVLPRPVVPIPGGCKLETDAAPNDGVQFIFGRDSRVDVRAGRMELCAQPSQNSQEIAVYGLKSGTGVGIPSLGQPASYDAGSLVRFTNPDKGVVNDATAACLDTTCASAALNGNSASETLTSFALTPSIPAGSRITGATLRLGHQESIPLNVTSLTATVTPGTGSAVSCSLSAIAVRTVSTCDLLAKGMDNGPAALSGITVQYTAQASGGLGTTAWLDGAEILVTYVAPSFEAEDGCLIVPYTQAARNNGTACPLIKTSGALTTVAMQGTIYAPPAPIDLRGTNISFQILGRGVISRVFRIDVVPAIGFTGFPVGIPANGPRSDREVLFAVTVSGRTRLRALVTFGDGGGLTPGATVTVGSWSVIR